MSASHIYQRLLAGKVTPDRYVAVVKRAVDMQMSPGDDRRMATSLLSGPKIERLTFRKENH